ncbi:MAG: sensor histidine kinase [Bacteroidetes bacterium]|nr:sensor histidine kinase [Bacteroidota bacterium]
MIYARRKSITVFIHIALWAAVIFLPLLLFGIPVTEDINNLFISVSNVLPLIPLFYLNAYVFVPRFLSRRKFLSYSLLIAGSIFAVFVIQNSYRPYLEPNFHGGPGRHKEFRPHETAEEENCKHLRPPPPQRKPRLDFGSVFAAFFILAISTSIKVTREYFDKERQRKESETEKLNAELMFLKSQVNPHFLFNTLNSIYSLAYDRSDNTPEAVVRLSQMMRYMLDESNKDIVELEKEIDYLKSYIDLQKLRMPENFSVDFKIRGEIRNILIEPLLLLPLIENAFKHTVDNSGNPLISIVLKIENNVVCLRVENPVDEEYTDTGKEGWGVGLSNLNKRLTLLYPDRHKLTLEQKSLKYTAELIITLRDVELYSR